MNKDEHTGWSGEFRSGHRLPVAETGFEITINSKLR